MQHTLLICGYGPGISRAVDRRFGKAGYPAARVARNAPRQAAALEELSGEGILAHTLAPAEIAERFRELHRARQVHWVVFGGSVPVSEAMRHD